jgi:hypothetical protein
MTCIVVFQSPPIAYMALVPCLLLMSTHSSQVCGDAGAHKPVQYKNLAIQLGTTHDI